MKENNVFKKPLIGFLPAINNLGDTLPLLEIAKKYKKLGGKAVFFSEGGKFINIIERAGFKFIQIKIDVPKKILKENAKLEAEVNYKEIIPEKSWFQSFNYNQDSIMIEKTAEVLKNEKVKLLITNYIICPYISAKITKIPIVFLTSGVAIPPFFKSKHATFPDNFENFITKLIPSFIKDRITNWFILRSKEGIKEYNILANSYNINPLNRFLDLFKGDYTLVADDINFLNIKPTTNYPLKNFIGFIKPEPVPIPYNINTEIKKHLNKSGKSILLSLGSSGFKKTFVDIINALNKTNYNIIAIYTSLLEEKELPEVNENILLKKFVPSIEKINEKVDLAIIHGGRGTVYTAAYSGKPAIGIPMHSEQQHNLDNLVRHGSAIRLSGKYFKEEMLLKAIEKIFSNYEKYLKNAQLLKSKLSKPNGADKAANRIIEIINSL